MALAANYVLEERVAKRITGGIILNLRPKNIEKIFHLSGKISINIDIPSSKKVV